MRSGPRDILAGRFVAAVSAVASAFCCTPSKPRRYLCNWSPVRQARARLRKGIRTFRLNPRKPVIRSHCSEIRSHSGTKTIFLIRNDVKPDLFSAKRGQYRNQATLHLAYHPDVCPAKPPLRVGPPSVRPVIRDGPPHAGATSQQSDRHRPPAGRPAACDTGRLDDRRAG